MAWEDVANSANRDIYGRFISRSGALVRTPFAISSASGNQSIDPFNPIAFDGANYLVVWRDERNGSANRDFYGQLVTPAGTLSGSEIPIATASESEQEASAAFDGTNYLVVWSRDIGPGFPSPDDWDIYARLVTRSGALAGNEFAITTAPGSQPFATGIYDGANYLREEFLLCLVPSVFGKEITGEQYEPRPFELDEVDDQAIPFANHLVQIAGEDHFHRVWLGVGTRMPGKGSWRRQAVASVPFLQSRVIAIGNWFPNN